METDEIMALLKELAEESIARLSRDGCQAAARALGQKVTIALQTLQGITDDEV